MYTNDRMLLIASGVDRSDLDKLTKDIASASTSETKAGAETRSKKATYYGGMYINLPVAKCGIM